MIKSCPDIWKDKQTYTEACFMIKPILVKDVPMNEFYHLKNAEGKPLRRSRDTEVINFEEGLEITRIIAHYNSQNSILF